jgi:hypothetical protein
LKAALQLVDGYPLTIAANNPIFRGKTRQWSTADLCLLYRNGGRGGDGFALREIVPVASTASAVNDR